VAASGVSDVGSVRSFPKRLAKYTPEAAAANSRLKKFLYQNVYSIPELAADRRDSMRRVAELFRFFVAHPNYLPEPYGQQAMTNPVHRVVCDYVAGMTDSFFRRVYEQVLGSDPGSPGPLGAQALY